jgi:hypothetical protein
VRRYRCRICTRQFQSDRRREENEPLWNAYVEKKQTLTQLAKAHNHSHVWVRRRLDAVPVPHAAITPEPTVIIADTTFWGRHYGVCVFRSHHLKKAIWWHEVESERMAHYRFGRNILEEKGWTITGAVVDGRRGFIKVFSDIPLQICQFHQMRQVAKYISRRPEKDAGRELWKLTLTLTETDEATFTKGLQEWHTKWGDYIEEKTVNEFETGKKTWYYTHKKVLSAYRSLERNLPYLFTYLRYPELNMPNTTNDLDGSFSNLKKKLGVHHGLRRDRRFKVISQILKDAH